MRTQGCAIKLVENAIKRGELVRPDKCEICGKVMKKTNHVQPIVAHHWNGYDDALNVVWVCRSCNGLLDVHDGSLNLEGMKKYVRYRQYAKLGYILNDNDSRLQSSR